MQQILIQEKASPRLQKLRTTNLKRLNKGRQPNVFKVNDYCLVHNKRWPQHKWPKLASPWQGPFKVLKVKFNMLQIMASPSLGGVIDVALHMCKKWSLDLYETIFDNPELDDDVQDPISDSMIPPNTDEIMSSDDAADIGYFNVHKLMKHKFQQGWKFLVWWENFPASQATWEPISAFILPNGSVNLVFKQYCLDKG